MKHKSFYDEEAGVLRIAYIGKVTTDEFRALNAEWNKLSVEKRNKVLVDLSQLENPLWDRETRKTLSEETDEFEGAKVAMVGVAPSLRVLAKLFSQKQKHDVRYFKTEAQAIAWLKEES